MSKDIRDIHIDASDSLPMAMGIDAIDRISCYEQKINLNVGRRIKKIRVEKGLSQAQLGSLVGLTGERIQKYESGFRTPKYDMLSNIAKALGVDVLALINQDIGVPLGAMYAMFELEDMYDMNIEYIEDAEDPRLSLSMNVGSNVMSAFMYAWFAKYSEVKKELEGATCDAEKQTILKEYHDWKWNFPASVEGDVVKDLKKELLRGEIKRLQEAYDKLDDDGDK